MARSGQNRTVDCPVCRGSDTRVYYRENGFAYRLCDGCGLLFLHPQPEEGFLEDHYQEYLSIDPGEVRAWGREMRLVNRRAAATCTRMFSQPGRVLDVGCGYGFFLEEMLRRKWKVEGVELSRPAAELARQRIGAAIHSRPLEDADIRPGLDLITLFYVIEHLPRPDRTLARAAELLKSGGILLLRYPNSRPILSLSKTVSKKLRIMQAPSHLFDYSRDSLKILLTKAGFEPIRTTIDSHTLPSHPVAKVISFATGSIGMLAARASRNRFLLPGVSRTTLARLCSEENRGLPR
ncbi:MAG: class I SAM-dependent methyltransferase [Desulfovibrionales bacterium]